MYCILAQLTLTQSGTGPGQAHRDVTVTRHGHWHDAIYDDTQIFSCVLLISFVFLQLTCACGE